MVETKTGHNRSNGISYNDILKSDTVPPPAVYLEDSPYPPGVTTVKTHRYFSQQEHDLEVEMLWKRVWQMACHSSDVANIGDTHVYDIAELSYIVVRVSETEVKPFPMRAFTVDALCVITIARNCEYSAAHFMAGRGIWMAD